MFILPTLPLVNTTRGTAINFLEERLVISALQMQSVGNAWTEENLTDTPIPDESAAATGTTEIMLAMKHAHVILRKTELMAVS